MRQERGRRRRGAALAGGLIVVVVFVVTQLGRPSGPATPTAASFGSAGAGPPSLGVADHPTLPPAGEASEPTLSATPPATRPATPAPTDPGLPARPVSMPTTRVATRVTVPALGIDLPVMRQNTPYPACDVAMYILELGQPGQGGVTYLYAHAQSGNFLPLLKESLVNDGARMLGMAVDVYTGDNFRFTYRISEVRRHITSMDGAFAWQGGESVWLQTSEGQVATVPKLQVLATHVATAAADDVAAHPVPRPTTC